MKLFILQFSPDFFISSFKSQHSFNILAPALKTPSVPYLLSENKRDAS